MVIRNLDAFDTQLDKYFVCELSGHDPSNPCDRSRFRLLSNPGLTAMTFILLGLFPLFNLIYALNYEELMKRCRACFKGKKFEDDYVEYIARTFNIIIFSNQTNLDGYDYQG